jgi:hypothetical protein
VRRSLNASGQKGILSGLIGAARFRAPISGGLPEIGGATRHYFWLNARGGGPGLESAVAMSTDEERELREQLARLQQEHRDLDAAISALQHSPGSDLLQVQRLKKRKLHLRDRISHIEDQLTPDIIA